VRSATIGLDVHSENLCNLCNLWID
jgi:hypothetical protein